MPAGTWRRIGVDRDADRFLDQDERDVCSDPAKPKSVPCHRHGRLRPAATSAPGAACRIAAVGSAVAADGDLRLAAVSLPIQGAGSFSGSMTQVFIPRPGGSAGNLCIAGDVARLAAQLRTMWATGPFSIEVDLTAIPTNPNQPVLAGQATSNFTDRISILFQ